MAVYNTYPHSSRELERTERLEVFVWQLQLGVTRILLVLQQTEARRSVTRPGKVKERMRRNQVQVYDILYVFKELLSD